MANEIDWHEKHLIEARQKAQDDFDKMVGALSAGALAVSMTFLEKIVTPSKAVHTNALLGAWLCWAASLFFVLASYYLSHFALSRALNDFYKHTTATPGGWFSRFTHFFNLLGGLLFIVGTVLMACFVHRNLVRIP